MVEGFDWGCELEGLKDFVVRFGRVAGYDFGFWWGLDLDLDLDLVFDYIDFAFDVLELLVMERDLDQDLV